MYSPLFYYIFTAFSFVIPVSIAAKVFSALLVSSLTIPVFLISKRLTSKTYVSLLTSSLSIFIPAYISFTFNTFSPYCLMIPLMFFALYFAMDIKKYKYYFILTSILGAFIHPSFLLLAISFTLYLILVKISGFDIYTGRLEAILFSIIVTFWAVFIIYKNALLLDGISIIWQNTPEQILRHYFSGIGILEAIYKIGLVPLIAGIFVIYKYVSSKLSKEIYLLISFVLCIILLTALHLLRPESGLAFTGIVMTILFAMFLSDLWDYLENARSKSIRVMILAAILVAVIFTNILPSVMYTQESLKKSDIQDKVYALEWLKENSIPGEVVLSSMDEGNIVTFFADRPNVMDSDFISQADADIRLKDTDSIYKTPYSTEAITLLNKYGVRYILFSPETASYYRTPELRFLNKNCFELIYDKDVRIYKSLCRMERQ